MEGMRNANEIIIPKIEAIYLCCPANEPVRPRRKEMEIRWIYAESEIYKIFVLKFNRTVDSGRGRLKLHTSEY